MVMLYPSSIWFTDLNLGGSKPASSKVIGTPVEKPTSGAAKWAVVMVGSTDPETVGTDTPASAASALTISCKSYDWPP